MTGRRTRARGFALPEPRQRSTCQPTERRLPQTRRRAPESSRAQPVRRQRQRPPQERDAGRQVTPDRRTPELEAAQACCVLHRGGPPGVDRPECPGPKLIPFSLRVYRQPLSVTLGPLRSDSLAQGAHSHAPKRRDARPSAAAKANRLTASRSLVRALRSPRAHASPAKPNGSAMADPPAFGLRLRVADRKGDQLLLDPLQLFGRRSELGP